MNINPVLRNYTAVIETAANTFVSSLAPPTEPPPFVNTLRDRNEISYSLTPIQAPGRHASTSCRAFPRAARTSSSSGRRGRSSTPLRDAPRSSLFVPTVAFFPQEPLNSYNNYDPIDRRAVTAQTWSVAWEGPLAGVRNTGQMCRCGRLACSPVDPVMQRTDSLFNDGGANYCALGVVPGDLVTLTGCTDNSQCGLGEACVEGDASRRRPASHRDRDLRRSEPAGPPEGGLRAVPQQPAPLRGRARLAQRPRHPAAHRRDRLLGADARLSPRHSRHSATTKAIPDSCPDLIDDPTTARFKCVSSYPVGGTKLRCLMPCQLNSDCRAGRLCVNYKSAQVVQQFCDQAPTDGGTGSGGSAGTDAPARARTASAPTRRRSTKSGRAASISW